MKASTQASTSMSQTALKRWLAVHKYASLVCTLFLLMTCITGLPLIFHDDIDRLTGHAPVMPFVAASTPHPSIDRTIASAEAAHPGNVALMLVLDRDEPALATIRLAPRIDSGARESFTQPVDLRTARTIEVPRREDGLVWTMFRLHTDLYTGLAGTLLLGTMGLLFAISVVSGIVVYRPFMRKLAFGTVRQEKARRVRWLDLHNLLGIVTLAWALVVGVTGTINTLAIPMLSLWQAGQLAEMTAPYRGLPPLGAERSSVAAAIVTAQRAAPDMTPFIVAMPGSMFSSAHHHAIYMRGNTPLTARLLKPALIDARTGELTDMREMPWYVRVLFLSQPLHFGDYGGRFMQIIWALLDLVTIAVLVTGLYLWIARSGSRAKAEAKNGD